MPGMRPSVEPYLHCASVSTPRFEADGQALAFLSNLCGNWEAFRVALPGADGPAWPDRLTFTGDRVGDVRPVPGRPGSHLVLADEGGDERWRLLLVGPGEVRDLDPGPGLMRHLGEPSPHQGLIAYSSNRRSANVFDVYVDRLDAPGARPVFVRDALSHPLSFSPGGDALLVRETRPNKDQALWLVSLDAGAPRLLFEGPADMVSQFGEPSWSPDGRTLYLVTNAGREFWSLVRLDVASGRVDDLYAPDADVDEATLSPDGATLALCENRHGTSVVRRLGVAGGRAETVLDGGGVVEGIAWAPDGSCLGFVWDRADAGRDLYVQALDGGSPVAVTRVPMGGLDRTSLVAPELVTLTARDGLALEALFYRPPAEHSPYRAVWLVHGGPESQSREAFDAVAQFLAAAGLAVVKPNVRGSTGYGRAFEHADDVERRLDSVDDLQDMVGALAARGLIDPARQAVMGGSYGGFMTLSTLTRHPELWCAGVDIVGIANLVTFLERTSAWRRPVREAEYGSLEHDRTLLEEISPIRHADRIRAPLLVIHGRRDPRVPVEEAEQMVAELRRRDHPVEYLVYEDEGHGLTKIRNRVDAYGRIAAFLLEQTEAP